MLEYKHRCTYPNNIGVCRSRRKAWILLPEHYQMPFQRQLFLQITDMVHSSNNDPSRQNKNKSATQVSPKSNKLS